MTTTNGIKSTSSLGSADRWLVLILVSLAYFVLFLHRSLINYLHLPLKEDLGLTDLQIGWLQTAFMLPYALSQLGVGYLGDRFRRRSVLLSSLVASVVVMSATGLVRNFTEFMVLRVILGFAQAASVPAIASVMADCFTPRNRSTAIGIYLFSYNFALVMAGWQGGRISDTPTWHIPLEMFHGQSLEVAGWRMAMFTFGAVGGLMTLILYALFREPRRTERAQNAGLGTSGAGLWSTIMAVLRVPSFLALATIFVLVCIVTNAIQFWLPISLQERFHLSQTDAGLFSTIWIQTGTFAGLLLGGKWADWWAHRSRAGRTAVQLIGLLVLIPALIVIGKSDMRMLLGVVMFLFGIGVGWYQANLWTTTFEVIDPAARATSIGLLNVASGIFASWFAPVIGYLKEEGFVSLDNLLAGMGLVAALAVAMMIFNIKYLLPCDYRGPVT